MCLIKVCRYVVNKGMSVCVYRVYIITLLWTIDLRIISVRAKLYYALLTIDCVSKYTLVGNLDAFFIHYDSSYINPDTNMINKII